ncbi:MAG: recombination protein RecR [Candidatus Portnoybacteria bacterium CG_4_8_14_3_um_filter_44_15]|uniref:Recombination protein RecR n=4 Tax=Candidatus Portnoyibacteriota TaxID=1817913 RepID=A0A2M7YLJ2_9BACT|nr:MAG: recombination protein RecR [Parcubacteria group bacterium CG1_02_44_65]PIP15902.1 MAG: recombination protein RecR [Candidatus Portnoybacteria bacterium CG23_combo_of_CG06-09_8_20_14_all_44_36]PIW74849.1 MAG: recombination protein RecR [Candidatus Portnoybacteria bacterium CG_4_8_14_3_um_filter_44_15]PIZ69083.1 MAG: recombination protein RecR [Candidatus Portnoybacteria bacterium CG_4_10_14_0_2_um_filter_43_36]PJA63829.1 MAG: recombination protein RecR [Candidatus Portnoybacteria bacteri
MFPSSIKKLISELSKLPEIGPRAATRLVLHLLNRDQSELDNLSSVIKTLKSETQLCQQCFNLTEKDQNFCPICQDLKRDRQTVCLVENVLNIIPLEKTGYYHGLYHVLGGLISPGNGAGPEKLKIKELIERLKVAEPKIAEVIFALSPTTEGDTTTLYIERLLRPFKIKTSRLGRGLSVGSDLEYIDENTLTNALLSRK